MIKRIALLFLVPLLFAALLLAYVVFTNGGLQRLASLGQSYLADELTIAQVDGKIIGPASAGDIRYKNDAGMQVQVDSVAYDWQPRRLFKRKLYIDNLDVSGVTVRLPEPVAGEAATINEPFQLKDLRIPLAVEARQLSITNITIYPPGSDVPIIVDELILRAGGEEDELQLVELSVSAPQGELTLGGMVNTSGDWPLSLESEWQLIHEQFGTFIGSGSAAGDLQSLNVTQQVSGPASVQLDAKLNDVTGMVNWDGKVDVTADNLGVFSEGLSDVPLDLALNTKGSIEQFSAAGKLNTDLTQTGPFETDFNLSGDLKSIEFTDSTVAFDNAPTKLAYAGAVDLATGKADITLDWKDLVYPLIEEPMLVASPQGSLQFAGSAEDYKVSMQSKVEQDQTGLLDVVVVAEGSTKKVSINTLSVEGPPNTVSTTGEVDLTTRAVDLQGNWRNLRWPLTGVEQLVNSETAEFSVSGTLDDYQIDATMELAGKDIPPGSWQLSSSGNTEALTDLKLNGKVMQGSIDVTGDVKLQPVPSWDLDINTFNINPGEKWPEHEGRVTLAASTQGSLGDKGLVLEANIKELSGDYRDQALAGGGRVTLADGKFSAEKMKARVGNTTVDINGAFGDTLDLEWQVNAEQIASLVPGTEGDINLAGKLTGSRDEPKLEFNLDAKDFKSGTLQGNSLTGRGLIDLPGNSESVINLSGESLQLDSYRWESLKIEGGGKPAEHQLSVQLAGDAPDINLKLSGGIQDDTWRANLEQLQLLQTPVGDWNLHEPVNLAVTRESAQTGVLCLTNLPAVVCADTNWQSSTGIKARVALENFNSELFSDLTPPDIQIDAPLSGAIDFAMQPGAKPTATAHFEIPAGEIQFESKGDIITAVLGESEADITLTANKMNATAALALGEIGTIDITTDVSDLYGKQNLSGEVLSEVQDISLAGIGATQLQSIDGAFFSSLTLGGTLQAPQLVGDVNLQNFAAEVPSLALKLKDGNITAKSDGNGKLNIEGDIKSGEGSLALEGFFNPESGQMEIDLIGDVFLVANAKRHMVVISPEMKLQIDGDTISVTGDLAIPSAFIKAGGESGVVAESTDVRVAAGTSETPEDNPNSRVNLNLKVSLGEDVRVKVGQFDGALSGGLTLEQLPGRLPTGSGVIEVVSGDFIVYGQKLTMERGRILFGGGPLDNPALDLDVARDVVAYDVKAGAVVKGTAKAPILELQSDPPQTDANTISYILFGKPVGTGVSYTLGKFITPRLYVSYGIDLFDRLQTFNMRYSVTERLALIASSSTISSADLIYTIER